MLTWHTNSQENKNFMSKRLPTPAVYDTVQHTDSHTVELPNGTSGPQAFHSAIFRAHKLHYVKQYY